MSKIVAALITLILLSTFVSAQSPMNGSSGTVGSANASVITIPVNGSYSQTVSPNSAYTAESYIIGKLGQDYYNKYIKLYGGSSYGNTSYVYFTYSIPFANNTTATGIIGGTSPVVRQLGLTVTVSGSNVTGYLGPDKPYVVTLNKTSAISIAENAGLLNDTAGIEGAFVNPDEAFSYYYVVWAVTSNNPVKGMVYKGLYIDANSGNVIGEYIYNPAIVAASGLNRYGDLGNFTLFNLESPNQPQGFQMPLYAYAALAVIIIAAAALMLSRIRNR